jgi:hypothetical protein
VFARVAEIAENENFSFAADPRGIGFAFHRAGTPANENTQPLRGRVFLE